MIESIDHARISERAYAIWEQSGCPGGDALEHWYRAESELRTEYLITLAAAPAAEAAPASGRAAPKAAKSAAAAKPAAKQKAAPAKAAKAPKAAAADIAPKRKRRPRPAADQAPATLN
ncbi:hypothetical protein ATO13_16614 [Stappia sp. 22II-S9-Z10]|nr:hypothetical protein ATO13_16614 [Stappia sp. 22II-S9-Z10]